MTGFYPDNGLAPGVRNNGVALTASMNTGCDITYYDERCSQRIDPRAFNHLLSEMTTIMNQAEACDASFNYDCSAFDNLFRAIDTLINCRTGITRQSAAPQVIPQSTLTSITGMTDIIGTDRFIDSTFDGETLKIGPRDAGRWVMHGYVEPNTNAGGSAGRNFLNLVAGGRTVSRSANEYENRGVSAKIESAKDSGHGVIALSWPLSVNRLDELMESNDGLLHRLGCVAGQNGDFSC